MTKSTKEVIIIAGGNGVGKTTFAREFLLEYPDYEFLNADDIAAEISPENPRKNKIAAGKTFFKKLDEFVEREKSFLIESKLSGRYLIRFIKLLREKDYQITIIFLFADSPEILIERIKNRVAKGGHFIPDEDVRRRFTRGKENFWKLYKDLSDSWSLFYNTSDGFKKIAAGEKDKTVMIDEDLFGSFLESLK